MRSVRSFSGLGSAQTFESFKEFTRPLCYAPPPSQSRPFIVNDQDVNHEALLDALTGDIEDACTKQVQDCRKCQESAGGLLDVGSC